MCTGPSVPLGFMLEAVASKPTELLASWSEPQPPNGVITGYTLTCTRSTNQVNTCFWKLLYQIFTESMLYITFLNQ